MAVTGAWNILFDGATKTITSNGLVLGCNVYLAFAGGIITLADDFNSINTVTIGRQGTFDTVDFDITADIIYISSAAAARTISLGSSIVTCRWYETISVANLTFNCETSTINCSSNFLAGGLTYNIVNLTGATSIVSGDNAFAQFNLTNGTTQTIEGGASTQTATSFSLSGSVGHIHTLNNINFTKSGGGKVYASFISLLNSAGSPSNTFYYLRGYTTYGTGCSGWLPYPVEFRPEYKIEVRDSNGVLKWVL